MFRLAFSIPPFLLAALGIGLLQPLYLLAATRIRRLAGRYSLQFLAACAAALMLWAAAVAAVPALRPSGSGRTILALMVLACAMLVYLELWGLLTRGYTLGVLRTLREADGPLAPDEIAARYRGGESLDWLMRHRLGGLAAAGLVKRCGPQIALTPLRGMIVVRLYRASILALGLRDTG